MDLDIVIEDESSWISKTALEPVKKQSSTSQMGMTVGSTTTYNYSGTYGAPLSEGQTWSYDATSTPEMGAPETKMWNAEVVAMEEVTIPAGTFNCYKVEHTTEGITKTEWWSADDDFLTPVKVVDTASWNNIETRELVSYTVAVE